MPRAARYAPQRDMRRDALSRAAQQLRACLRFAASASYAARNGMPRDDAPECCRYATLRCRHIFYERLICRCRYYNMLSPIDIAAVCRCCCRHAAIIIDDAAHYALF